MDGEPSSLVDEEDGEEEVEDGEDTIYSTLEEVKAETTSLKTPLGRPFGLSSISFSTCSLASLSYSTGSISSLGYSQGSPSTARSCYFTAVPALVVEEVKPGEKESSGQNASVKRG